MDSVFQPGVFQIGVFQIGVVEVDVYWRRLGWFPPEEEVAPPVLAGSLFTSLVDQYGATRALHVFQQMYAERKGPFQEGAKYDPERPSVARKVAKAGGVIPDPQAQLMAFIGKKLRR